ncbi:PREDICTED: PRKR-interacting protein 1 [Ficedula albicollis]|nr:PREDICTED: PRKR-interacting protein 1 [Ficedula albicollis]
MAQAACHGGTRKCCIAYTLTGKGLEVGFDDPRGVSCVSLSPHGADSAALLALRAPHGGSLTQLAPPQPLVIPRSAAEEQRLRLERLMRNPEKTVPIPEKLNEWAPRPPPEFVRDVMGSSAGAGSGEFHVYRHLRRREYQRQDFMDAMAEKQRLDEEFQKKLERNKMIAEEQTAKRRRKRQKLKEKKLQAKKNKLEQKKQEKEPGQSQEQGSSEDDEEDSKEEEEKEDDAEEPSFVMGRG